MNAIEEIKPVRVTYALKDIFNALEKSITDLEEKMRLEQNADHDTTYSINHMQTVIKTRKAALEKIGEWLSEGVEYVDTDATLSESNIPRYIHSDSICSQVSNGRFKPTKLDL